MMKATLFCFLLCCLGLLAPAQAAEPPLVTLYAYHLKPPFIINLRQRLGLYYDLADYLNSQGGSYRFRTRFLPRKRLQHDLALQQLDGLVIGVSPVWFDDREEQKYLWTPGFFHDQDEFLSLAERRFDYRGPESLHGMSLAGVLGFAYAGIDPEVGAGRIRRSDTAGEREVLQMVLKGRVDVGIVSRSTLEYLQPTASWRERLHVSATPHDSFQRRVLVPREKQAVHAYLLPIIARMQRDPAWQAIVRQYR